MRRLDSEAVHDFERLLAAPCEQFDLHSEVLTALLASLWREDNTMIDRQHPASAADVAGAVARAINDTGLARAHVRTVAESDTWCGSSLAHDAHGSCYGVALAQDPHVGQFGTDQPPGRADHELTAAQAARRAAIYGLPWSDPRLAADRAALTSAGAIRNAGLRPDTICAVDWLAFGLLPETCPNSEPPPVVTLLRQECECRHIVQSPACDTCAQLALSFGPDWHCQRCHEAGHPCRAPLTVSAVRRTGDPKADALACAALIEHADLGNLTFADRDAIMRAAELLWMMGRGW